MITSDKYKIHWWGIGANGSATMFWAFTNLFNMPTKKGAGGRRNNYDNNSFKNGYKKIVNTRNPYEWITAVLLDHNQLDNFDDYLKKNLMNLELMKQVKEWEEDARMVISEDLKNRWLGDRSMYKRLLLQKVPVKTIDLLEDLMERMSGKKIPQRLVHKLISGKLTFSEL